MSDQMLHAFREDAEHAVAPVDFGVIEHRGARRRLRHRAAGVAVAAAVLAAVGSLTLLGEGSAPTPTPSDDPGLTGFPLIQEGADGRIPPGRSELPPMTRDTPLAAVTVVIPDGKRGWGENIDRSGIYSGTQATSGWLHVAAYVVDAVVERPCREAFIPPSGPVAGYAAPGPTMQDLADAIAGLPRGKVLSPPRTVEKWGTTAIHVRLEMARTTCRTGYRFYMFDTATGGESIGNMQAVVDFWVLRVNGQRLVVETEAPISATRAQRRTLAGMIESVRLHRL